MKHIIEQAARRLSEQQGMRVFDVMTHNGSIKDLKLLATCCRQLNISTTYNSIAESVLNGKYDSGKEMLKDVTTLLRYFGGDCYRNIGSTIVQKLKDDLEIAGL